MEKYTSVQGFGMTEDSMSKKTAMRKCLALLGVLVLVCAMGLCSALAEGNVLEYAGAREENADAGQANGSIHGSVEFSGDLQMVVSCTMARAASVTRPSSAKTVRLTSAVSPRATIR